MSFKLLTTGENAFTLDKRVIETFIAGGSITSGHWVMLDTSAADSDRVLKVVQASAAFATGNPLVVGVAIESASSGGTVKVVTRGYVEGANVATAVNAAGLALVVDNTSAGRAVALADTDIAPPCGVSLEAASSNTCDVFVFGLAR